MPSRGLACLFAWVVAAWGALDAPAGLAATGGPDAFGTSWADGSEPGVTFAWEDISATGTDLMMTADDATTGLMTLSFAMPYYGAQYSTVAVSTNGFVSLVDGASSSSFNRALPQVGAPRGVIAPLWDDLDPAGGRVLFQDFGDRAVVTWDDVFALETGARVTVQVVLRADGVIDVQHLSLPDAGAAATIGIESPDETTGLTVSSNRPVGWTSSGIVRFARGGPPAPGLDCLGALPIGCGDVVLGTLAGAPPSTEDTYACLGTGFDAGERVHEVTAPAGSVLRVRFTALSGSPRLAILGACDASTCLAPALDDVLLRAGATPIHLVVDARAGEEGSFELRVDCQAPEFTACADDPSGGTTIEHDHWGRGMGTWSSVDWLFEPQDTSDRALRIDGGPRWSASDTCQRWRSIAFGADGPDGPGRVQWTAQDAVVTETLTPTSEGGCCGLEVEIAVTNLDDVPHSYEWRTYHDTAFGRSTGTGNCPPDTNVDGGAVEVIDRRLEGEADLLALGAASCEGQVRMRSADDDTLRASWQVLPPTPPQVMELINWDDGLYPCTTWSGLVDGNLDPGCTDNSLLLIWRFPETGTLAPGESGIARYRVGLRCAWPCGACGSIDAVAGERDLGPCGDGVELAWTATAIPAGRVAAHVHRSPVSFADALASPAITPADGVLAASFVDPATMGGTWWYAVVLEAIDQPGCGDGPAASGPTIVLELGPVTDAADIVPPAGVVGAALRATGHGTDTVDFEWTLAPPAGPGERFGVTRADDDPRGPFLLQSLLDEQRWTDPAAPPRYIPVHVWFYDVRIADGCANLSRD